MCFITHNNLHTTWGCWTVCASLELPPARLEPPQFTLFVFTCCKFVCVHFMSTLCCRIIAGSQYKGMPLETVCNHNATVLAMLTQCIQLSVEVVLRYTIWFIINSHVLHAVVFTIVLLEQYLIRSLFGVDVHCMLEQRWRSYLVGFVQFVFVFVLSHLPSAFGSRHILLCRTT